MNFQLGLSLTQIKLELNIVIIIWLSSDEGTLNIFINGCTFTLLTFSEVIEPISFRTGRFLFNEPSGRLPSRFEHLLYLCSIFPFIYFKTCSREVNAVRVSLKSLLLLESSFLILSSSPKSILQANDYASPIQKVA